jgi:type II secretory pathway predicted ATPase ExeA
MYESFYHLHTNPFSLTPDPNFCFSHSGYRQAREYLEYALKLGEGLVMVTGRPGTGKTTLAATFLDTLNMGSVRAAHIAASSLDADNLLRTVAYAFDIRTEQDDRASLRHSIRQYFEKMVRSGQRALLIIDEAQGLPAAALDELRLLADLHSRSRQMLQLFLIGQEQLRERMSDPEMEYFQQRVIANYHLVPLDLMESRDYVEYRLRQAGWQGDPELTGDAVLDIYRFSRGVPRHINKLCNRLLLLGYGVGRHKLDSDDVQAIAEEMDAEQLRPMSHVQSGDEKLAEALDIQGLQQNSLSDLAIRVSGSQQIQQKIEPPLWVSAAEESEAPVAELSESNREADSPVALVPPEIVNTNIPSPIKLHGWNQWLSGMSSWQERLVPSLGLLTVAVLSVTVATGGYINDGNHRPDVNTDVSLVQKPLPETATVSPADSEGEALFVPVMVAEPASTVAVEGEFAATDESMLQAVLNDELPDTAAGHPQSSATLEAVFDEVVDSPIAGVIAASGGDESDPADGVLQNTVAVNEAGTDSAGPEPDRVADAEEKSPAVEPEGDSDVQVVDSLDAEVENLLAQGYRALEDFKLLTPAQDSAYYYFQAALRLAPDNTDAMAGLGLIAERYVLLANKALRKKDRVMADRFIARGLSLQPDNSKLLTLKEGLNEPVISLADESDDRPAKKDDWQKISDFFSQVKTFLSSDDQERPEILATYQATSSYLRE